MALAPGPVSQAAAGRLRQRLVFRSRVLVEDGMGNSHADFVDRFEEPAELIVAGLGSEAVVAARLEGRQPVVIRVRYNSRTVQVQDDWVAVDARNRGIVYVLRAPPVDRIQDRRWLEMPATLGGTAP
jgi:head-tail adaptor